MRCGLAAALTTALACEPPPSPPDGEPDGGATAEAAPATESSGDETAGGAAPASAPTPRVATLEYDGGRFEAEFGGRGQLPTGFPEDVPIYEGSEPHSSMAAPGRGQIVHLRTVADSDHVFEYYREALAFRGWEEEASSSRLGDHQLRVRKGNRVTRVTIQSDGTHTLILLSVAEER